jgi:predicted transposase YdaD
MNLPEELEKQFQQELKVFEEARQMKYVTTIERMAEERGEERGRVEERLTTQTEIALKMLRDNLSSEQISRLTGMTIEQIQALQVQGDQETEPKG